MTIKSRTSNVCNTWRSNQECLMFVTHDDQIKNVYSLSFISVVVLIEEKKRNQTVSMSS